MLSSYNEETKLPNSFTQVLIKSEDNRTAAFSRRLQRFEAGLVQHGGRGGAQVLISSHILREVSYRIMPHCKAVGKCSQGVEPERGNEFVEWLASLCHPSKLTCGRTFL